MRISRYNSDILLTDPGDGNLLVNVSILISCYCHLNPRKWYCGDMWIWGRIIFCSIVICGGGSFIISIFSIDFIDFVTIAITTSSHAINSTSFVQMIISSPAISTSHPTIWTPFSSSTWIRNSFFFVIFMSFTVIAIICSFVLMWTFISVSSMPTQTLCPYHRCCCCLIMTRPTSTTSRKTLSITAILGFNLNPTIGCQNCSVTIVLFLTIFMISSFNKIIPLF